MAQLRIPPEHRAAVVALSQLPLSDVEALASDLKGATPSMRGVRDAVGKYFQSNVAPITAALVSLAMTLAASPDATAKKLSADLRETLGDDGGDADLTVLLGSPTLMALTKTIDLRTAHERILQDFRIFTDIRPVFGNEVDEPISSAIVTHVARITYGTSESVKELFVGLNHQDLLEIKKVVERALTKEERANQFIESRDGRVLDSFQDEETE